MFDGAVQLVTFMSRYFITATYGALAGLLFAISLAVSGAHYPNIPRPPGYFVGAGLQSEFQDALMDQEVGLYVAKQVVEQAPDIVTRSVAICVFFHFVLLQFSRIGYSINVPRRVLVRFLKHRYTVSAGCGVLIAFVGAYLANSFCFFLSLSWLINNFVFAEFAFSGIFCLSVLEQLRALDRIGLTTCNLIIRLSALAVSFDCLIELWPDITTSIPTNTYRILGFESPHSFGWHRCGQMSSLTSSRLIPWLLDSLLILLFLYAALHVSKSVLVAYAIPITKKFFERPTFLYIIQITTSIGILILVDSALYLPLTNLSFPSPQSEKIYQRRKTPAFYSATGELLSAPTSAESIGVPSRFDKD